MKKFFLPVFILICAGCSGGGNGSDGGGGNNSPATIAGNWQIISTSTQNPGQSFPHAAIETLLSQTGTKVFSGSQATLVIPFYVQGTNYSVGESACGGIQATIDGTISGHTLNFTLTETGPSGSYTVTGTGTVSSNERSVTGTYSSTAACGFGGDAGTFTGTWIGSISGNYSVSFDTGTTLQLAVSENEQQIVVATGSYSGSSFTLNGGMLGGLLALQGTVEGVGQVDYLALYLDSTLITLIPSVNGTQTKSGDFIVFSADLSIGLARKR